MHHSRCGVLDEGRELAHAGAHPLIGQPEPLCRRPGLGVERRIVALRQMDEPLVVAEIDRQQLGMPIETEPADHQRLELPGEEIGEIEGAGLGLGQCREARLAGEGGIAMRAGQPLDRLLGEHRIERPAGAAIGIGHIDPVMRRPGRPYRVPHRTGDQRRPVVQGRRQTAQVDRRQPIRLDDGDDLAGQRAAGDDERAKGRIPARDPTGRLMIGVHFG